MEKKIFCPNCGTQLPSSAKFCNKCGCSIPSNENANSSQNSVSIEESKGGVETKQIEPVVDDSCMDKEDQPKPLFSVSNIIRWVIVTIIAFIINDGGIGGFILAALCIGVDVLIRVFQTKYSWSVVKATFVAMLIGLSAYFIINSMFENTSSSSSYSSSSRISESTIRRAVKYAMESQGGVTCQDVYNIEELPSSDSYDYKCEVKIKIMGLLEKRQLVKVKINGFGEVDKYWVINNDMDSYD